MDVSDIFYFFPVRGGGRGSPRRRDGGGVDFSLKIPGRGGGLQEGRGREAGRVSAANLGIGRGGPKYFFSGPKRPPRCFFVRVGMFFASARGRMIFSTSGPPFGNVSVSLFLVKTTNLTHNSLKIAFFPEDLEGTNVFQNYSSNSQGTTVTVSQYSCVRRRKKKRSPPGHVEEGGGEKYMETKEDVRIFEEALRHFKGVIS